LISCVCTSDFFDNHISCSQLKLEERYDNPLTLTSNHTIEDLPVAPVSIVSDDEGEFDGSTTQLYRSIKLAVPTLPKADRQHSLHRPVQPPSKKQEVQQALSVEYDDDEDGEDPSKDISAALTELQQKLTLNSRNLDFFSVKS
jgi:hypothetical protein